MQATQETPIVSRLVATRLAWMVAQSERIGAVHLRLSLSRDALCRTS
jgi:hypothetical protein